MTLASVDEREPAPELATLADLPFHVLGRYPKPLLVGQVANGAVRGESPKHKDWTLPVY